LEDIWMDCMVAWHGMAWNGTQAERERERERESVEASI
jgi:hypothetical protein